MRGDTDADIVAEANRPDRAPCRSIHVRSGVARRLHGLAVVVDDTIPENPGFECHREAPKPPLTCNNRDEPPGR